MRITQWAKKIWCSITGGCVYDDLMLLSWYDIKKEAYIFRNQCTKCGVEFRHELPRELLMPPIHRNPFIVDVHQPPKGE